MKKVIEQLEKAKGSLGLCRVSNSQDSTMIVDALIHIDKAILELKIPRWVTPEQWGTEHGRPWPVSWPVWFRSREDCAFCWSDWSSWIALSLADVMKEQVIRSNDNIQIEYQIACIYMVPGPPPDDWKPEGSIMTEQDCFDEYMKLCDLQSKNNRFNSKGFYPEDTACCRVWFLINEMTRLELEKNINTTDKFTNYFFKCKGRTFSICVYANGFMELRWG